MAQDLSEVTSYQTNYEKIINDPIYEEIKLNKRLNEEIKFSKTLCNQLKNKYENLEKYCEDLQNNFNNVNNILKEKQEFKKNIGDLNDHNTRLIKLLIETLEEKNDVIQEKDNTIQEKDRKIQVIDNLIKEKDKEIQAKDIIIQEKDNIIQDKDNIIKEKDNIIEELVNNFQVTDNIVQEKYNKIQEIIKKDKEIQDLKKTNINLKYEASGYQAALGSAIELYNDNNSLRILREDIFCLQDLLLRYITNCKNRIEINIPGVQSLLKTYGSKTTITEKNPFKPLIKAVLQRHAIEQIFNYAKEYFDNPYTREIETIMLKKANNLSRLAEDFANQRDGVDEPTKVLHIKLRQEICAALINRGFNNVVNKKKNQSFPHNFISEYQDVLNNEIGKYRRILDPERRKNVENMAGEVIRKVVTLFWFRLRIQEPIPQKFWFGHNENIDPSRMEGIWDEDEIDNIVVDVCYFPLIANDSKVYTCAKIFPSSKNR
ncbi:hypothetical protein RhiirA5_406097 [Rhizophagus irregularis]|uniref:Uncharacterized protein n=1 Tax=Rhizophagus irregularis TaxID=588596 RepID=A0A2N0QDW1_9GLOM|nr:hypothetical protein RhiirA5_406097 [Rhizophagus irregularis]CAB5127248.1 unnamed protein product [Rhizophagus irregularis]